ncbi:beta-1,3-galactosyltransferase 5-like [Heptranchias perlo]|uniref:beta-1,3-galactosyltransferase 5-like n=1 Tax=Heptranchias perlo TaxID=212740 RepID=UPI00355AB1DF
MKIFSSASCSSTLFQKKHIGFVCVPLFMIFITLGYLSRTRFDDWRYPEVNEASFLMLPESRCDVSPPFLVLLVTSAVDQFEARSTIRQTWGRESTAHDRRVVTYFLLGHGQEHQEQLVEESWKHKDIIQKNFSDSYHNLTVKVLMGLEWVKRFCPSSSFVMKTDTDMFVNTDYLRELLSQTSNKDIFTGYIMGNSKPIRDQSSKWYVSKQEYPQDMYPPFCSGTGYVLSADLACRVWDVSSSVPKLKLEDVYIGLCLAKLKIQPVEIHSLQTFHITKVHFSVCGFRKIVTSHGVKPFELLLYWKTLADSAQEVCPAET